VLCYDFKASKLKLGDIKGALLDTEFAMREGDNNAKALFRQGQVGIGIEELAVKCLELLLHFIVSVYLLLWYLMLPAFNSGNYVIANLPGIHGTP